LRRVRRSTAINEPHASNDDRTCQSLRPFGKTLETPNAGYSALPEHPFHHPIAQELQAF
jgi:hypothetical protein